MIFEGAPCLGEDLSLPIWAFSARARSTGGRAPAVISLSQPKVKPDAMKLSPGAGIHLPASLLALRVVPQGVCATQQCKAPATRVQDTRNWRFFAGPHGQLWRQGLLQGRACSQSNYEHCTNMPASATCGSKPDAHEPACLSMQQQPMRPQCLSEAPPSCNSTSAAATSSSKAADSKAPGMTPDPSPHGMPRSDLQPRRALALLPFQGMGSSTAADGGQAEGMLQGSHARAQPCDPQMEAILCSDNQSSREHSWSDGAPWQACRDKATQDVRSEQKWSVICQMSSLRGAEPEAGASSGCSRGAAMAISLSADVHHEEMPHQKAQAAADTSGHEAELCGDAHHGFSRHSQAGKTERLVREAEEENEFVERPGTPSAGMDAVRLELETNQGAQWPIPAATLQQQAASLRCQVMHLSIYHTAAHMYNLMHRV